MLFLQHVIDSLKPGGRCGIACLDEGVLFRTNETAFVQTKRKLLDDCDLWCIVSLPAGVFSQRRRRRQDQPALLHQGPADGEDLVLRPLRRQGRQEDAVHARRMDDFFELPAGRRRSDRPTDAAGPSRASNRGEQLRPQGGQPARVVEEDTRTPEELLDVIERQQAIIAEAIAELRGLGRP